MSLHCAVASLSLIAASFFSNINAFAATGDDFSWGTATVYFVITDRYANGDTSNDCNYGRINDYGSDRLNAATFHGGDLKGMLEIARQGYFTKMGVDVVWMTDVYEQLHGWMSGSGDVNDFPHYGYHGYYPLDYTQIDKNYGTAAELRQLIDTLHAQGIRVMLGANLNNPGYPTLLDAAQYGFADTKPYTDAAAHHPQWSYSKWAADSPNWPRWWSGGWLRTVDDSSDKRRFTLFGLPDFLTESSQHVTIPQFLKDKWSAEGHSNDAWLCPAAAALRSDREWTPMQYLTAWIAAWVEEFGIDGFRCDIVEYVDIECWRALSDACNAALKRWRSAHPDDCASQWTDSFYMTGDFDDAYIDYKPEYAAAGFSSIVNFYFPKRGDLDAAVYQWQSYADSIAAHADWHPFNYLNNSYHRDADMNHITDCATTLLLSPGVAQIFYGDETRRQVNAGATLNVDSDQAFRSDMNWASADTAVLAHYRKLGTIRKQHKAIAVGRQRTIDCHTCVRYADADTIVIRLLPHPGEPIATADAFADGCIVTDLCTGATARVSNSAVTLDSVYHTGKVAILALTPNP